MINISDYFCLFSKLLITESGDFCLSLYKLPKLTPVNPATPDTPDTPATPDTFILLNLPVNNVDEHVNDYNNNGYVNYIYYYYYF